MSSQKRSNPTSECVSSSRERWRLVVCFSRLSSSFVGIIVWSHLFHEVVSSPRCMCCSCKQKELLPTKQVWSNDVLQQRSQHYTVLTTTALPSKAESNKLRLRPITAPQPMWLVDDHVLQLLPECSRQAMCHQLASVLEAVWFKSATTDLFRKLKKPLLSSFRPASSRK